MSFIRDFWLRETMTRRIRHLEKTCEKLKFDRDCALKELNRWKNLAVSASDERHILRERIREFENEILNLKG